jgi:hypothetical protein
MNKGLWDEFKEKTLRNYKGCDMTMYKYFNLIAHDKLGQEDDKLGQEDLITCAFPTANVIYGLDHPDLVWNKLHEDWITYLRSVNHEFKEHDDE